jgi:protein phosphatase
MGTTVTALVLAPGEGDEPDTIVIANVGDSRAYLFRDGEFTQITEDHSLVEDLVREGRLTPEEARTHPQKNVLTRVLGNDSDVDVDAFPVVPYTGDRFVLCSDGLFNELDDNVIAGVLRRLADPDEAARELVRLANEEGGRDNITVVVVDVVDDGDAAKHASEALAASPTVAHPVETVLPPEEEERARPPGAAGVQPVGVSRPRRITWRSVLFVVLVLAVLGGAVGAVAWYGRNTFYVGADGDRVAIYRGRPGGVLWFDPTVEEPTGLKLTEVPAARRQDVQNGKQESTLDAARRYVRNLTPTTTTTTTTTSTTTTTTAPPGLIPPSSTTP